MSLMLIGCLRSLICYIQAPVGPPILGDFYQQIDSCSPQNWGARGAKFNIKKLGRYPLIADS
ncbi:hypothetical protein BJP34_20615 [Moorena producens PAL-8-15-08-1]|uniref:Uncharacterized protein n=1 Tax=Moorena producens PAL-8-15-08-1 TaxID=1458985 RepID=A0A1D8TVN3_9CYAN|nr:hypothetical protein BJP34_20615 [Moorena producens PAL-8-15-08-1]